MLPIVETGGASCDILHGRASRRPLVNQTQQIDVLRSLYRLGGARKVPLKLASSCRKEIASRDCVKDVLFDGDES